MIHAAAELCKRTGASRFAAFTPIEGHMKYVKPDRIVLKGHPELNERWVQDRLAEDPGLLGLGDLILKDKERNHPQAGRLDLLFQDPDSDRRYEVEVQLGRSDESHIIRTIEYWDIERKRYPQYDHVAVIVAEEITARFLNVIGLFNGHIPLIAIQMQALGFDDRVSLAFSTVLGEMRLGTDEDDEPPETTDRAYWDAKAGRQTMEVLDSVVAIVRDIDPSFGPKYNKWYVGLARNGQPLNFIVFRPKSQWVRVEIKLDRSEAIQNRLEEAGIDLMEYSNREGRYKLRLSKGDAQKHDALLRELFQSSFNAFTEHG
jgi:hypothetical protein